MASKKVWHLQNTEDPQLFGLGTMDIVYDSGGRMVQLENEEKLRFLLVKCVLTGRYVEDSNSYGSTIPRLMGLKVRSKNELVDGMFLLAVDRAVESFKKGQPFDLDDRERMVRRDQEIQVARDSRDRTILLVGTAIRNGAGKLIEVIHSFKTY